MKINEIFYSIQGEGAWTGTPMIFIRFSGCNLNCPFCDTKHKTNKTMTVANILAAINRYPGERVCLTGGEPGMQVTDELIGALHAQGRKVHIETNGSYKLPANVDWITFSPKNDRHVLTAADEIKVVYEGQDVAKWLLFNANEYYLQPCSCENTNEVVEYVKANPQWKVSIQTQKYIEVR